MNKILLLEAINQSNLHPTTKSFLTSVLKNIDPQQLAEEEEMAYLYNDMEKPRNEANDRLMATLQLDARNKGRDYLPPSDIDLAGVWPGDKNFAE